MLNAVFAELVCRSNFSFLRGASHPEDLVFTAAREGLYALALTDGDGLYGVVKAHLAAKQLNVKLLIGSQLTLTDAPSLVVYAQDLEGYRNLSRVISESRLSHPKGEAGVPWQFLAQHARGLIALLPFPAPIDRVAPLAEAFSGRFYVGTARLLCSDDAVRRARAEQLAQKLGAPLCAHNDVHTHSRRRQPLQDVLTAIRHKTALAAAGNKLFPNAERTMKGPREMAELFADQPEPVGRTLEIADACHFSVEELRYCFSEETLPPGHTPMSYLRQLTLKGLFTRYPQGTPADVGKQIERELDLIEKLNFPGYFLAIWDIVRFARERGILCQGRGSAANSAVCYALQITSIDPVRMGLLFERFISAERNEPPDIDVDFEHERREEVLQYVYEKHGRARSGMVCEVVCYRGKLAVREVGKALGLSLDQVDRLSRVVGMRGDAGLTDELLLEAGVSPKDPKVRKTAQLSSELEGFPRHLSIHVGGFVITREPLSQIVPLEMAAMKGRTVVQWDKDDLNAVGVLKVDLLGLGMLTVLSKAFALIREHHQIDLSLATIPAEDPQVYEMLCEADSIGVFQVESRAQMNMLPRLKPKTFYDLVIEIAIIRPGPIIGDMVHPYIRRRDGIEKVDYPSPEVEEILKKTLGVPLFQEQAMKLAIVAAGFTPGEADQLRRILTHKRAEELLLPYQNRFIEGCVARGYPRDFAEKCFRQFLGFSHYGFPESHSASFALIAYASSYLKCYFPAAFTAAILNSQPMGFYAAHTLVDDVKRHGVEVRGVDVNASRWDCTLEDGALRLGLRLVKGLRQETARRIEKADRPFESLSDLARRAKIPRFELIRLAMAGALVSLSRGRREALWEIQSLSPLEEEDLFFGLPMDRVEVELPAMRTVERVCTDYETTGLSVEQHPVALMRRRLSALGALSAKDLHQATAGRSVRVGGMVICRQRPGTAKGFCFISLEDETGISNLVIEPPLFDRFRREILTSVFLLGEGVLERAGKVTNVKVKRLKRLWLDLTTPGTESLEQAADRLCS